MSSYIYTQLIKLFNSCKSGAVMVFLAVFSGLIFLADFNASAQGNLLITPRRVVLEGSTKSFDLNLANTGKDSATYAISIIQIRMKEDGGFETITVPDPNQQFADHFIRFFPRSVTLAPNEAQVVKVQLIKANELTAGEYRSHFYFRSIPNSKPLGQEEINRDTTSISVKLTPVFGITIPVIIRVGESNTSVSLTDLVLENVNNDVPRLSLIFNRTGNMSVYGDVSVDYISTQGRTIHIINANGVAVYTPNIKRNIKLNLTKTTGVDFHSGKLIVTYSASSDVRPTRFAEAELELK
jgi:hypothetical protein